MKRSEHEYILRAATTIANDFDVLVLGSQSILGSFTEDELPDKAYASTEVDVTFFDDDENDKSDLVDMHLGRTPDSMRLGVAPQPDERGASFVPAAGPVDCVRRGAGPS